MNKRLHELVSALMDGELTKEEVGSLCGEDIANVRKVWRDYSRIQFGLQSTSKIENIEFVAEDTTIEKNWQVDGQTLPTLEAKLEEVRFVDWDIFRQVSAAIAREETVAETTTTQNTPPTQPIAPLEQSVSTNLVEKIEDVLRRWFRPVGGLAVVTSLALVVMFSVNNLEDTDGEEIGAKVMYEGEPPAELNNESLEDEDPVTTIDERLPGQYVTYRSFVGRLSGFINR